MPRRSTFSIDVEYFFLSQPVRSSHCHVNLSLLSLTLHTYSTIVSLRSNYWPIQYIFISAKCPCHILTSTQSIGRFQQLSIRASRTLPSEGSWRHVHLLQIHFQQAIHQPAIHWQTSSHLCQCRACSAIFQAYRAHISSQLLPIGQSTSDKRPMTKISKTRNGNTDADLSLFLRT